MKKALTIILSICVMFGAAAFMKPPCKEKAPSDVTAFVITQDQTIVTDNKAEISFEKASFEFLITGESLASVVTVYVEKPQAEVFSERWQPGNRKIYKENIATIKNTPTKLSSQAVHVNRLFLYKSRMC